MLKLKLQYFGHLMRRADSPEKTVMLGRLKAGRVEGNRGWDDWMTSLTQWTWVEQTLEDSEGQGSLACCSPWDHKESDITWQLNNNNLQLTTQRNISLTKHPFITKVYNSGKVDGEKSTGNKVWKVKNIRGIQACHSSSISTWSTRKLSKPCPFEFLCRFHYIDTTDKFIGHG